MNTKQKPDWFMKKNPNGTVPVLETASGQVIYESPITCEYLEEVYPEKKLCPADPFERAQNKMLLENYSKVGRLAFGIVCITHLLICIVNPIVVKNNYVFRLYFSLNHFRF